jgi:hypothetical protein
MYWILNKNYRLSLALVTCYFISAQGCSQKRTLIKEDGVTHANFADTDRFLSPEEALEKAHFPGIGEGSGEPSDYLYAVREATDKPAYQVKNDSQETFFSALEPGVFTPGMEERHQQLKERGPKSEADVARDFDQMIREEGPYTRLVRADN